VVHHDDDDDDDDDDEDEDEDDEIRTWYSLSTFWATWFLAYACVYNKRLHAFGSFFILHIL
jgi:hypothetical protein